MFTIKVLLKMSHAGNSAKSFGSPVLPNKSKDKFQAAVFIRPPKPGPRMFQFPYFEFLEVPSSFQTFTVTG